MNVFLSWLHNQSNFMHPKSSAEQNNGLLSCLNECILRYLVSSIGKQVIHCEPAEFQKMFCCVIRFVQLWAKREIILQLLIKLLVFTMKLFIHHVKRQNTVLNLKWYQNMWIRLIITVRNYFLFQT